MWKILMTLALTILVQADNLDIIPLTNNPGLLPFKLGQTKLITAKHEFLHYISLDSLKEQISSFKNAFISLNKTLSSEPPDALKPSLFNNFNSLKPLLTDMESKFSNIIFQE